jgi:hypothetical protein
MAPRPLHENAKKRQGVDVLAIVEQIGRGHHVECWGATPRLSKKDYGTLSARTRYSWLCWVRTSTSEFQQEHQRDVMLKRRKRMEEMY